MKKILSQTPSLPVQKTPDHHRKRKMQLLTLYSKNSPQLKPNHTFIWLSLKGVSGAMILMISQMQHATEILIFKTILECLNKSSANSALIIRCSGLIIDMDADCGNLDRIFSVSYYKSKSGLQFVNSSNKYAYQ